MALLRAAPGLKSGEHLNNDGRDISSIVNASVIGTLPNQPHPLYSLLERGILAIGRLIADSQSRS